MILIYILLIVSNTGQGVGKYGISAAEFSHKETCEAALNAAKEYVGFSDGRCIEVEVKRK